jgi:hypothetical protein
VHIEKAGHHAEGEAVHEAGEVAEDGEGAGSGGETRGCDFTAEFIFGAKVDLLVDGALGAFKGVGACRRGEEVGHLAETPVGELDESVVTGGFAGVLMEEGELEEVGNGGFRVGGEVALGVANGGARDGLEHSWEGTLTPGLKCEQFAHELVHTAAGD